MWLVGRCRRVDVHIGCGVGRRGAVVAWWGESRVGSWSAGRVLELLMGLLSGHLEVLVEPSRIGRSLVQYISGRVCPVPDEVATAVCVF